MGKVLFQLVILQPLYSLGSGYLCYIYLVTFTTALYTKALYKCCILLLLLY